MLHWSRWALGVSCLLGLGNATFVYFDSPERVPVHFGPTGMPDRWGSPLSLLVVHVCVIGLSTALFFSLPELLRRAPKALINLPNKEYWLAPEHRERAAATFARWADCMGTAVNALMITLQLVVPRTGHESAAMANALPAIVTLAFVSFTLCSVVWLALSFRLPARAK